MPATPTQKQPLAGPAPAKPSAGHLPAKSGLSVVIPSRVMATGDGSFLITAGRPVEWLSVSEAARALGHSRRTVRRWCHGGQLVWQRRGLRPMWVAAASVRAMLENDSEKELDRIVTARMATLA